MPRLFAGNHLLKQRGWNCLFECLNYQKQSRLLTNSEPSSIRLGFGSHFYHRLAVVAVSKIYPIQSHPVVVFETFQLSH